MNEDKWILLHITFVMNTCCTHIAHVIVCVIRMKTTLAFTFWLSARTQQLNETVVLYWLIDSVHFWCSFHRDADKWKVVVAAYGAFNLVMNKKKSKLMLMLCKCWNDQSNYCNCTDDYMLWLMRQEWLSTRDASWWLFDMDL